MRSFDADGLGARLSLLRDGELKMKMTAEQKYTRAMELINEAVSLSDELPEMKAELEVAYREFDRKESEFWEQCDLFREEGVGTPKGWVDTVKPYQDARNAENDVCNRLWRVYMDTPQMKRVIEIDHEIEKIADGRFRKTKRYEKMRFECILAWKNRIFMRGGWFMLI